MKTAVSATRPQSQSDFFTWMLERFSQYFFSAPGVSPTLRKDLVYVKTQTIIN